MKVVTNFNLPKEIAEANPVILAQAVRVYLANQRQGTQSALTRAEVSRTRKKYQKQKGSGNARHGDRKAPIFVGGGVSFAPKPRDHSLSLPDKMKRQATLGAFFAKNKAGELFVVSEMDKATGKTKEFSELVDSKKTLIVTDTYRDNVYRGARNIAGVTVLPMDQVNTYEILRADKVLVMEEAFMTKPAKKDVEVKEEKKAASEEKEVKKDVSKKTTVKKAVSVSKTKRVAKK